MKIKIHYLYRNQWRERCEELSDVISLIKNGKYSKGVALLRQQIQEYIAYGNMELPESANHLPIIEFDSYEEGKFNGLIMLSLPVENKEQTNRVRKVVEALPQTMCSFVGSSEKTLKIIMRYTLTDGNLPKDAKGIAVFRANAYVKAVAFLLHLTGIKAVANKDFVDACRFSFDKDAFFNENAVEIMMPMPEEMPEDVLPVDEINEIKQDKDILPDYSEREMEVLRFNLICRNLGLSRFYGEPDEVITLAEACRKAGVMQEMAVKCTLRMPRFYEKDMMVRTAFDEAYEHHSAGNTSVLGRKLMQQEWLRRFLKTRYRFRQNDVTGSVEYIDVNRYVTEWKPFNDEAQNTVCIEAQRAGIEAWDKDISRYVHSSLVSHYDPIALWLMDLPEWDGKDRVGELAATVKTYWDEWTDMFRVWMRSMVSQWRGLNQMYGATMVLMLTGKQGTGKSTFCKRLMPNELLAYYNDRIDFTNKKDAERALMRFCLINLDEFDQISPRQSAYLKHMLQKSDVKWRKMYQDDIEQKRRYAAFCATTNSDSPLTDTTGSRRYMCVEVIDAIDTSYKIDYQQLYAQVLYELRHDLPSYFDAEMERKVQEHNIIYTAEQPLEEILQMLYRPAYKDEECEKLTSTQIMLELQQKLKGASLLKLTPIKMGILLASAGFPKCSSDHKRIYKVVRL